MSEPDPAGRPPMVVVASFPDPIGAELAALRLAQEGIASQLLDGNLLLADPLLNFAIGGVKVAVAAADAETARQLLAQHRVDVGVARCPECGAADIARSRGGARAAWLTLLCLGFPIGRARARSRCRACGCRWRG